MSNAAELRVQRAEEALDAKDYETAVRLFQEDLSSGYRRDDRFHTQYVQGRLAFALMNVGRGPEAQQMLEDSLFRDYSDIPASVQILGQLYISSENWDALERLFQHQLASGRPQDWTLWIEQSIGRVADSAVELAEAGIDNQTSISRAEDLARRYAVGTLVAVRCRKGQALEAQGDIDGAIVAYRAVAQPGATDPTGLARLLTLLERAGRTDEALTIIAQHLPGSSGDLHVDLAKRQQRLAKPRPKKRVAAARERRGTPGEQLAAATDAEVYLALESELRPDAETAKLDALTSRLVQQRLAGTSIGGGRWSDEVVRLDVTDDERALIAERFTLSSLESRGVWFMPDQISIGLDALTPLGTEAERGRGHTATNPEVIYLWALFVPLYRALEKPLALRERVAGQDRAKQKAAWQGIADLFESLAIDARIHLQSMSYGGGWSRLSAAERRSVQERLGDALRSWAPEAARRFRAIAVRDLVRAYYEKADADGRALRSKVVTTALRPPFIAYFGGDWLGFLDYLGEQPHPNEQIQTALPETRLNAPTTKTLEKKVAAGLLPAEEAERIVTSFWGSAEAPFEARVNALRRYWGEFDQIHAQQAPGMLSLWGLVEESHDLGFFGNVGDTKNAGIFRQRFSSELLGEIEQLWAKVAWQRDPSVQVSNPQPHITVAQAIGPAIEFWHGAALTAWFICEGPYSRTSLEEMAAYYADRGLDTMAEMGMPVDPKLFSDLLAAQKKLKPRPRRPEDQQRFMAEGLEFTITMQIGPPRMEGFEHLRDVITRHRRAWAQEYLDPCLQARWETDAKAAAVAHNRLIGEKGRPPTLREFAKEPVRETVNCWFGGDFAQLYRTLGEACPTATREAPRVMPAQPAALVAAVAAAVHLRIPGRYGDEERDAWDRKRKASELGIFALHYVQTREGLGRAPTLKEVGTEKFERAQAVWQLQGAGRTFIFGDDQERAYALYSSIVEQSLADLVAGRAPAVPVSFLHSSSNTPAAETSTSFKRDAPASIEKPGVLGRLFGRRKQQ